VSPFAQSDPLPTAARPVSVSNIAWPAEADDEALDLVATLGFDGVELAPSKVFGDLSAVTLQSLHSYRRAVEGRGLRISALQAILFGVDGAHLFESVASRSRMASHLRRIAEIAGALGARACVFGAPTLRDPGLLPPKDAIAIATEFLRSLAPDYHAQHVQLCFEANPEIYHCRFITRTEEALALVTAVDAPGIAIQLDTGTMFANEEDPAIIRRAEDHIGHFHISEPNLVPPGSGRLDHVPIADVLRSSSYRSWVSVEMKAAADWAGALLRANQLVRSLYVPKDGSK
jgi:D-psicose/D-tagatose/L-ribulose 3-epimerase